MLRWASFKHDLKVELLPLWPTDQQINRLTTTHFFHYTPIQLHFVAVHCYCRSESCSWLSWRGWIRFAALLQRQSIVGDHRGQKLLGTRREYETNHRQICRSVVESDVLKIVNDKVNVVFEFMLRKLLCVERLRQKRMKMNTHPHAGLCEQNIISEVDLKVMKLILKWTVVEGFLYTK